MRGMISGMSVLKAAVYTVIVWSLFVHALTATADTITIDSFNHPDAQAGGGTNFYVPGVLPWGTGVNFFDKNDAAVEEVIGKDRDIHVEVVGPAIPISASGTIGYEPVYDIGLLFLASGGRAGTYVTATYDGALGAGLGGIDLTDGGANNRLEIDFQSLDAGDLTDLELNIDIVSQGQHSYLKSQHTFVAEKIGSFTEKLYFDYFSDEDVLKSVDSITFTFNNMADPVSNVDFEIDNIKAVPEPSTIAMLSALVGASMLAVPWCRRRKR